MTAQGKVLLCSVLALSVATPSMVLVSCTSKESTAEPGSPGSDSERSADSGPNGSSTDGSSNPSPDGSSSGDAPNDADTGAAWVGPDGGIAASMNFFVTSHGPGKGGDLRANVGDADGLAGADAFCKSLANAVSPVLGAKNWVAYLSTNAINARDRIGAGPYYNAKGVLIASSIAQLHDEGSQNLLTFDTNLDELGKPVPIAGPNVHDILTGTNANGSKNANHCSNWTSSGANVTARLGHANRMGGGQDPTSWNSAHDSAGCAEMGGSSVRSGGGRGSFYCFVK